MRLLKSSDAINKTFRFGGGAALIIGAVNAPTAAPRTWRRDGEVSGVLFDMT